MPLDCIVRTTFYSRLIFKCGWPLVAYAFLLGGARAAKKLGKDAMCDSLINFASLLQFLLYPSISTQLFSMFYCEPMEDGTSWLRQDLSLECGTLQYGGMIVFTWIMLAVHTIG